MDERIVDSDANEDWMNIINTPAEHATYRTQNINKLDQFHKIWDGHLVQINTATHRIGLSSPGATPIHTVPYRAFPKAREAEREEINKLLAMKIIEHAQIEWPLPILSVPKKDGTLPFCIDYVKLTAVTTRDSYRLSLMDECIDYLEDAIILFILVANSGYWKLEVHKSNLEKIVFTSHHGLYQFIRMPFGL